MNSENTMNTLQPIEINEKRILTTIQLAESYGTTPIKIQQNFNNNKGRYLENKHFFLLEGEALKEFKRNFENIEVAQNVNKLYLWTEKGAWMHAKSLGTDQAWDAYEMLVDEYYKVVEQTKMSTEQLTGMLAVRLGNEVAEIKKDIDNLRNNQPLHPAQSAHVTKEVNKRIYNVIDEYFMGNRKAAKKLFAAINKDIHRAFRSPNRAMIPNGKYEDVVQFIKSWQPDSVIRHQLRFELAEDIKKEA